MSNISDAFDAIKDLLVATFPNHLQLVNPYDLNENTTQSLLKGWGLAIGPGENSNRKLSCQLSIKRSINIPLTRVRHGSSLLVGNKETNEKLLLEDQYLLIKALEKDPTVNNNEVITSMKFQNDQGIQPVFSENDHYIALVSTFEIEYFEDLNT